MYDERIVTPMRQELTQLGVQEMRTPDEVDAKLRGSKGDDARRRQFSLRMCSAQCAPGRREGPSARRKALGTDHGLRRPGRSRRSARAQLLHRLSAVIAADCAAQGRTPGVHARAPQHRRPHRQRNRRRSCRRVRQVLRNTGNRGHDELTACRWRSAVKPTAGSPVLFSAVSVRSAPSAPSLSEWGVFHT